jgi:DNA-directed RNA polymerase subunit RPC12/RpoP
MEAVMAATTDRQAARARLVALALQEVDRLIPLDEKVPLRGQYMADFEDQADELDRTLVAAFLCERIALSGSSEAEVAGRCPHCHSDRVYLERDASVKQVLTPHGSVPVKKNHARCRACNRAFSPSGTRPADAHRG